MLFRRIAARLGRRDRTHADSIAIGQGLQNAGKFKDAVVYFRDAWEREGTVSSTTRYCRALALAGLTDELDSVAAAVNLEGLRSEPFTYLHDLDLRERRILLEVAPDICQTPAAITSLCRSVQFIVENDIPGDLVECGVYKGASAICMIRMLQSYGISDRKIWLYDTFEGMPEPEQVDRYSDTGKNKEESLSTWQRLKRNDGSKGSDWVYCSIDEVKRAVLQTGYPEQNIIFVKGLVEDTIPQTVPTQIALLRLDTDFYRSTKHELVHLYPRMPSAGILIIDDYGAFQGARQAVDEYIRERKLPLFLARIDEHVRLASKP